MALAALVNFLRAVMSCIYLEKNFQISSRGLDDEVHTVGALLIDQCSELPRRTAGANVALFRREIHHSIWWPQALQGQEQTEMKVKVKQVQFRCRWRIRIMRPRKVLAAFIGHLMARESLL